MLIRRKEGWELSEAAATPEAHYVDRRRLLAGMGISGLILAAPAVLNRVGAGYDALGPRAAVEDPSGGALSSPKKRAVRGRSTGHARKIRNDL
jgi:sulfoxide reductase catalytic subunit YedY